MVLGTYVFENFEADAIIYVFESYTDFIFCIPFIISGKSLPGEYVLRITECSGISVIGTCPINEIIAVKNVEYGTKPTTICSMSNTSDACCNYDPTDCFINYMGTAVQAACNGKDLCNAVSISATDTSSCGSYYPVLNHYLILEHYCLPCKHIL